MDEEPELYEMDLVLEILQGMDAPTPDFPWATREYCPGIRDPGFFRCLHRMRDLELIVPGQGIHQTAGTGPMHWASYGPPSAARRWLVASRDDTSWRAAIDDLEHLLRTGEERPGPRGEGSI